ncbi:hypothetical protein RIF29_05139 [Crotalaria pallida]|uniref:Uncharacterized protein n=1 Tax=Crotalaria pallida TaxID=3830 RepID=A0AAN9PA65_CROPI
MAPPKKVTNQNFRPNKSVASTALDNTNQPMAPLEKDCSNGATLNGTDSATTQEARRIRKQKEDTILRIMSQKQNSAWKHYLNDKMITEDILRQHVHQRLEEELGQIHKILENEKWATVTSVDGLNNPPNIDPMHVGNDLMIIEHEGSQREKTVESNGAQSHVDA